MSDILAKDINRYPNEYADMFEYRNQSKRFFKLHMKAQKKYKEANEKIQQRQLIDWTNRTSPTPIDHYLVLYWQVPATAAAASVACPCHSPI